MGLTTKLKALLALAGIAKFLPALAWVPGLGPVAGIASAVLGFCTLIVKRTFEGATIIFTNPVTFLVVGFTAMATFAMGLSIGSEEGRNRVAAMQQEREAADVAATERLNKALEARKVAEEATTRRTAGVSTVAPKSKPDAHRARPQRVRAKPEDTNRDGLCLPGFSAVWPKC